VEKQNIVYRNDNGSMITDTPLSVLKVTPAPTFSSITTDSAGNIYAVGYQGENEISDFGDNLKTVNNALYSAFIIKYDKTGKAQWVKNVTGGGRPYFLSVAAAPDGIYAAGFQFGDQPFNYGDNVTAKSNNRYDFNPNAVLVKYDYNGKTLWAKSVSYLFTQERSNDKSLFKAVTVAKDGSVYVTGHQDSENAADYGNGKTIITSDNAVIIKYDRDGNAQWVKNVKGAGSAQYNAMTAAPDDSIYVAGKQTFHAGYMHPPGDTLEYGGITTEGYHAEDGPLLVKYDAEGNAQWVKTLIAPDAQYNTLKVAPNGSIYVAGSIHGDSPVTGKSSNLIVDFGDNVTVAANKYKAVAVIAKYSPDGDVLWAKTADIDNSSLFNSISVTAGGDIYAVGGLTGKSSTHDYSHNKKTAIIHKYDSQGNKLWEKTADGEHSSMLRSSAYADGKIVLTGEQYGQGIYDYGSVKISAPSPYKNTVIMVLQE
jgi:hypothetical protein